MKIRSRCNVKNNVYIILILLIQYKLIQYKLIMTEWNTLIKSINTCFDLNQVTVYNIYLE